MSRDKKQKYLLYFVLMIVLIAASMFMNSRFVEIDACLDRGDAWDHDKNICKAECHDGEICVTDSETN